MPFLVAGALQLAAPAAVLVVLLYSVTLAYPVDERLTFGALSLALLGLAATVPTLLAAFFSGPLADRYDRGMLMRVVNLGSVLATVGLVADLIYAPETHVSMPGLPGFYIPLWLLLLYPAWSAIAVTTTMFRPPYNSSVAHLVETKDLGLANGAIYASAAGASTGATVAAGVLLTVGSAVYALGIAFVLFFVTQVALVLVDVDLSVRRRTKLRSVWSEARAGYAFLLRRRGLLQITVLALFVNLFAAIALVELGLYIATWLGLLSGFWYGTMIAASTSGVAAGFLAISHIRFEHRAGRIIILLTFVLGASLFGLGLVRSIWFALPIYFVYGMVSGMIVNIFLSVVQATVPDEMMGRVFSADEVGSYALIPLGQVVGGILVLAVHVQGSFLLAGGAIVAFAVLMLVSFASLRRLGYAPYPTSDAERPAL